MITTKASQPDDAFKPGKTAMKHPTPSTPPRLRQALACILAALQAVPLTLLSDVAKAQVAVTPQQTSPTQYRYDAQGNLTQVIESDVVNLSKTYTTPTGRAGETWAGQALSHGAPRVTRQSGE